MEPTDTVTLSDIRIRCILGCYPAERTRKRPVSLTVTLFTDISRAAHSDDLADAVNYDALTRQMIELAERSAFNLIETLAEAVAQHCLNTPGVAKVRVSVTKPAPRPFLAAATVTIERTHLNL